MIHPEDRPRLRKPDGKYIWILMQTVTIQTDEAGAVLRVLGVQTNITHLKKDDYPSGLSFLGLEGEPSFYNVDVAGHVLKISQSLFMLREQEILQLMLEGKSSAEITGLLSISKHTVNTHRKNILAKSGCKTLVELGARMGRTV